MVSYNPKNFDDEMFSDFDLSCFKNAYSQGDDEKAMLDGMISNVMLRIHLPFILIKKIYCDN